MKYLTLLLFAVFFTGTPFHAQDDFWRDISLLSHDFKPAPIPEKVLRKEQRQLAPWIPVAGGVGILGGLAFIVTEQGDIPQPPQAESDTIRLVCGTGNLQVFPLRNDLGEGLFIVDLFDVQLGRSEVLILNDSTLLLSPIGGVGMGRASIRIESANGLRATSELVLIVESTTMLEARPDTFSFQAVNTLTANILDNDSSPRPRLISVQRLEGDFFDLEFDFTENGDITVRASSGTNGGILTYQYTIEDDCGTQVTSTVMFRVNQSDCGNSYRINDEKAICETETGRLELVIDNQSDNLAYQWSSGSTSPVATGLAAGEYTVMVTNERTGCVDVLDGNVSSRFERVMGVPTIDNCGETSIIINLELLPPAVDMFRVNITGQDVDFPTLNLPRGRHIINNLDTILSPGQYIIEAEFVGSPELCRNSYPIRIDELIVRPQFSLLSVTPACAPEDGSATFVVAPEVPRPYVISSSRGFSDSRAADTVIINSLAEGQHEFQVNFNGCISEPITINIPPCFAPDEEGGEFGITIGRSLPFRSVESPVATGPIFSPGNSLYFTIPLGLGSAQLSGTFQGLREGTSLKIQSEIMFGLTHQYFVPNLPESFQFRGGLALHTNATGFRSGFVSGLDWRPKLLGGIHFNFGSFHPFAAPWRDRLLRFELRSPLVR